jgi:hypothetical protein
MANTQVYSLWIILEEKSRPQHLRNLSFTTDTDPDLSDLALHLGQVLNQLASIDAFDLEFLDSNRTELRRGITLRVMEQNTSDKNPLVVRYPLSEKTGRPFCMHMFFLCSLVSRSYSRCQSSLLQKC